MQTPDTVIVDYVDDLVERLEPLFPRSKTRACAMGYINGLRGSCKRKNS